MHYILMDAGELGQLYQELNLGNVRRYVTLDGLTEYAALPVGISAIIVDENPAQPSWGLPDELPAQDVSSTVKLLSKNELIDRIGDAAHVAILGLAKQSVQVEAWLFRFVNATPDSEGKSVDLNDPRTIAGIRGLEPILMNLGVVTEGWADGVLNA